MGRWGRIAAALLTVVTPASADGPRALLGNPSHACDREPGVERR